MPTLTRRRSPDAPEECWHVYYGDVHVGTIAIRTGMPPGENPWGWSCGFYPGVVAVGIRRKVFDGKVCYNFWGDALVRHARETEAVIAYEIETGAPSAYLELRLLSGKWARQAQKWREKQAKRKMSGKTQAP